MDVSLFDFDLPEAQIALRPASPRDSARLMVVEADGAISHRTLRDLLNRHAQVSDLIPLGGYVAGADPRTDRAVNRHPAMAAYLRQDMDESAPFASCVEQLGALLA